MRGKDVLRLLRADSRLASTRVEVVIAGEEDDWPELFTRPAAYVINADHHWLGLYFHEDGTATYWDSYGTPPLDSIFRWTNKRCVKPIRYNALCLQSPISDVCGLYVAFFIRMLNRGYDLSDIHKFFNGVNLLYNDTLVLSLFEKENEGTA